jgi:hypothetical protein
MKHVSLRLRAVICAALVALGLACFAGAAPAATPAQGSISPAVPSTAWDGKFYAATVVPDPNACTAGATDPIDLICDHFRLNVNSPFAGQRDVTVTITWADAINDFDLYVFTCPAVDAAGKCTMPGDLVASSAQAGTTSESVTFPATAGSRFEVRVIPFDVVASDYRGTATLGPGAPGAEAPPAIDPPVSVGNATVWEGDAGTRNATFSVWMDWPTLVPVTVNYVTLDSTATAGDYVTSTGVVLFQPGETAKTISIPVIGDTFPENAERFEVRLALPDPAVVVARLQDYQGFGTILDSDWLHRVVGTGSAGGGPFSLNVDNYKRGKLTYRGGGWYLAKRTISVATFNDLTKAVHIEGTGWKNGSVVSFVLDVRDAGPAGLLDTFVLNLGDGTNVGGTLSSGDIAFQA